MKRELLVTLSTAALIFLCSPLARAQSAMNAQSEASQATNRQWSNAAASNAQSANANGNGNSPAAQNENGATRKKASARKEASEMVPAHASLETTVDARRCHRGDQVRAKLGEKVQLKNGPALPDGTVLIGKVTADKTQPDNARLALRFTRAKLKDGTMVPIKAMIVAIEPGSAAMFSESNTVPARDLWNSHVYVVNQIGAVSGADLHSSVTGRNSAVITSHKKDDVKIEGGSRIDLAIAMQPDWHANGNHANPTM